ncbi:MAG TPA: carbon-nitrogen hydrolase family protein [Chthoniobacterales bacterium]|jgi:predicted amidohydrolase|nr:carbon-nitrogen hydrolase family protein [Chthoniobacterales bacterium]
MKVRVAIIQESPVWMDLGASLKKLARLMKAAAKKGARLVVVGETWLPGYPAWLDYCPGAALWDHAPTKTVFARLRQNSIAVPGAETRFLAKLTAELRVTLVIGVNEKVERGAGNGTLFNSLLTFGAKGELANRHRKLIPTYTERLVWGQGDGGGLESRSTPIGRIGGLICWEHWMPMARQALHLTGEHIHVAVWPTVHEMHQLASRHYAFEGRCFVLAAGLIMRAKDLPTELPPVPHLEGNEQAFVLRGGSAIIGPDGCYVVEPVFDREMTIIADVDLTAIDREKMTLDVSGHYNRPDVFDFSLRKQTPRRGATRSVAKQI